MVHRQLPFHKLCQLAFSITPKGELMIQILPLPLLVDPLRETIPTIAETKATALSWLLLRVGAGEGAFICPCVKAMLQQYWNNMKAGCELLFKLSFMTITGGFPDIFFSEVRKTFPQQAWLSILHKEVIEYLVAKCNQQYILQRNNWYG